MTRRDYLLISNVLHAWRESTDISEIVNDFCIALRRENKNFDAMRFRKAVFQDGERH